MNYAREDFLDEHSISKLKFCEHCVFGKHKMVSFNASTHKGILDYIHSDLGDLSQAFYW